MTNREEWTYFRGTVVSETIVTSNDVGSHVSCRGPCTIHELFINDPHTYLGLPLPVTLLRKVSHTHCVLFFSQ